jgi:hypothetical protein
MFNLDNWVENLHVAQDTKELIKQLIKRKEKERLLKFSLIFLTVINGFIIMVTIFWLFKIAKISNVNVFGILDYFSSSRASRVFIFLAISLFIISSYVSKEYKKKKDKYESLREEVSHKLSASWKIDEDSILKDNISEVLKTHKDINIRYRIK